MNYLDKIKETIAILYHHIQYVQENLNEYYTEVEFDLPKGTMDITDIYLENATPGKGTLIHDKDSEIKDRKTSEFLFNIFGGNIHTLQIEKNGTQDLKTPDAFYNGKYWEYKDVSTKTSINSRIKYAKKQLKTIAIRKGIEDNSVGLVIDISNKKMSTQEMISNISRKITEHFETGVDVVIKDGEKLILVLRK